MEISDTEFVRRLYYSVLKRPPDEAGLSHHAALLASGTVSREKLHEAFEQSAEAVELRGKYEAAFGGEAEIARKLASAGHARSARSIGPRVIEIEVSSRCNITPACVMCDIDLAGKAFDIPLEVVEKLAPLFPGATQILLHGIGEPLMNRDLMSIIALVPDRSKTGFNTNALMLTRSVAVRLVDLGIGWLNVSIDAATPETYRKIRRNDFSRVTNNIRGLIEARGDRKVPEVFINMTLMKENIAEAPAFVRLGAELGVNQVIFQQMNVQTAIAAPIESSGWVFDYRSQLLQNYPELHRDAIEAAYAAAAEAGIPLVYRQHY